MLQLDSLIFHHHFIKLALIIVSSYDLFFSGLYPKLLSFLVIHLITFFPCTQFLSKQLSASSRAVRICILLSEEERILNVISDMEYFLFIASNK